MKNVSFCRFSPFLAVFSTIDSHRNVQAPLTFLLSKTKSYAPITRPYVCQRTPTYRNSRISHVHVLYKLRARSDSSSKVIRTSISLMIRFENVLLGKLPNRPVIRRKYARVTAPLRPDTYKKLQ